MKYIASILTLTLMLCLSTQVTSAADAMHPAAALVTQTADKIQTQLRA